MYKIPLIISNNSNNPKSNGLFSLGNWSHFSNLSSTLIFLLQRQGFMKVSLPLLTQVTKMEILHGLYTFVLMSQTITLKIYKVLNARCSL